MTYLSATFEQLRDFAAREPYGSLPEQLQDALTDEMDTMEEDHEKAMELAENEAAGYEMDRDKAQDERDRMEDERDTLQVDVNDLNTELDCSIKREQETRCSLDQLIAHYRTT